MQEAYGNRQILGGLSHLEKVPKWGHSFVIGIPSGFTKELNLGLGCEVELRLEDGRLIIVPVDRKRRLERLVAGIRKDNLHEETDWGEKVGKEVVDMFMCKSLDFI